MPNICETEAGGPGDGLTMRRGIQERLAEALTLVEERRTPATKAGAEMSGLYRGAAAPLPAGARRPSPSSLTSDQLTPFWLFCLPVEDMLAGEPLPPASARIPHAAAAACWQAIEARQGAEPRREVDGELAAALADLSGEGERLDSAAVEVPGARWWPQWAAALSDAVAETRETRLGPLAERTPKRLLYHAETIAAALRAAPAIQQLKRVLGEPPIARLDAPRRAGLRQEIQRLARARAADPHVALYVIAYRLQNPAELFLTTADLDLGHATREGRVLSESREELILSHAAEQLTALQEPITAGGDWSSAVDRFEAAAGALASAADLDRHGASSAFLHEIAAAQETLGRLLSEVILPALRGDVGAWCPEAAALASPATVLAAEEAARALARMERSTVLIGARAVLRSEIAAITAEVAAAVSEIAARLAEPAAGAPAAGHVMALVSGARIIELIVGSDRAAEILVRHEVLLDRLWASGETGEPVEGIALSRQVK